jgi:hypothetical protein
VGFKACNGYAREEGTTLLRINTPCLFLKMCHGYGKEAEEENQLNLAVYNSTIYLLL